MSPSSPIRMALSRSRRSATSLVALYDLRGSCSTLITSRSKVLMRLGRLPISTSLWSSLAGTKEGLDHGVKVRGITMGWDGDRCFITWTRLMSTFRSYRLRLRSPQLPLLCRLLETPSHCQPPFLLSALCQVPHSRRRSPRIQLRLLTLLSRQSRPVPYYRPPQAFPLLLAGLRAALKRDALRRGFKFKLLSL